MRRCIHSLSSASDRAMEAGQHIPNEFEIAAEFKVSQGTARKAIGGLAADNLVVRRQGGAHSCSSTLPTTSCFASSICSRIGGRA